MQPSSYDHDRTRGYDARAVATAEAAEQQTLSDRDRSPFDQALDHLNRALQYLEHRVDRLYDGAKPALATQVLEGDAVVRAEETPDAGSSAIVAAVERLTEQFYAQADRIESITRGLEL